MAFAVLALAAASCGAGAPLGETPQESPPGPLGSPSFLSVGAVRCHGVRCENK